MAPLPPNEIQIIVDKIVAEKKVAAEIVNYAKAKDALMKLEEQHFGISHRRVPYIEIVLPNHMVAQMSPDDAKALQAAHDAIEKERLGRLDPAARKEVIAARQVLETAEKRLSGVVKAAADDVINNPSRYGASYDLQHKKLLHELKRLKSGAQRVYGEEMRIDSLQTVLKKKYKEQKEQFEIARVNDDADEMNKIGGVIRGLEKQLLTPEQIEKQVREKAIAGELMQRIYTVADDKAHKPLIERDNKLKQQMMKNPVIVKVYVDIQKSVAAEIKKREGGHLKFTEMIRPDISSATYKKLTEFHKMLEAEARTMKVNKTAAADIATDIILELEEPYQSKFEKSRTPEAPKSWPEKLDEQRKEEMREKGRGIGLSDVPPSNASVVRHDPDYSTFPGNFPDAPRGPRTNPNSPSKTNPASRNKPASRNPT